jgi:hypothetical protein
VSSQYGREGGGGGRLTGIACMYTISSVGHVRALNSSAMAATASGAAAPISTWQGQRG